MTDAKNKATRFSGIEISGGSHGEKTGRFSTEEEDLSRGGTSMKKGISFLVMCSLGATAALVAQQPSPTQSSSAVTQSPGTSATAHSKTHHHRSHRHQHQTSASTNSQV